MQLNFSLYPTAKIKQFGVHSVVEIPDIARAQKAPNVASFRRMAENVIHDLIPQREISTPRKVGKLNFFMKFRKESLLTVNSKNEPQRHATGKLP